ncbi:MAG: nicotinate-nucleotide adenylyltransferase [Lachnospiraceae bacterium]
MKDAYNEKEADKKSKIGIMGGTFRPIHNGHLVIAENARAQFELDQVLFIPTGHSPHKQQHDMMDAHHRCAMISLAIRDNFAFALDTQEVDSSQISYTYLTLQHLKEIYPNAVFYFILGADSLFDLEEWKEPGQILSACTILAAYRKHQHQEHFIQQISYLNEKYHSSIYPLQTPSLEVSSHDIRDRISKNQTIRYLVPRQVELYIQEYNLYQKNDLESTCGFNYSSQNLKIEKMLQDETN